jgi:hypothetical protein
MGWNLKKKWKKSKLRKGLKKVGDAHKLLLDPMGLFTDAGELSKYQQQADVLGVGARPRAQMELQEQEVKQQEQMLAKQEADVAKMEQDRLKRMKKARQGKRSLLYAGGNEQGVSTTLGGQ